MVLIGGVANNLRREPKDMKFLNKTREPRDMENIIFYPTNLRIKKI
jgi:hypothetical protein